MFLFLFSSVLLFAQTSFVDISNTDGSLDKPYQLWTKEHLEELSDSIDNSSILLGYSRWYSGKHFRLMQDVTDTLRKSIGTLRGVAGHFHGGGHRMVVGINAETSAVYACVFRALDNNSSVDSLILDGYLNGTGYYYGTVAMFLGAYSTSIISHCVNNATIKGEGIITGGIVGSNSGTIINCVNNGDISGTDRVGGIVGQNSDINGVIENCTNNGKITAINSGQINYTVGVGGVGGIIGAVYTMAKF